jgi:hypothetical protein
MAKLTAAQRRKLPSQAFALPEKRAYPIHDRGHAMAALSDVDKYGTPEEQKRVRAAVHARYPSMGKADTNDTDEGTD